MSTPDYKWLTEGRCSQGPFCDGNDGPATIKLGSAPLTLRATVAKGYGQFTITIDCVRSTTESTRTYVRAKVRFTSRRLTPKFIHFSKKKPA